MVNFTVSIPEDLKAEMDKFPEVNWSNLTRKSIQEYLSNRNSWYPPVEFEIEEMHLRYDNDLMKPSLSLSLKSTSKLDYQLVVDRILYKIEFDKEYGRGKLQGAFSEQSLGYQLISTSGSKITLSFYPEITMLRRLRDKLDATFWVYVTLQAYVQGFTSPNTNVLSIKVPIDEWKTQVEAVLDRYSSDWNSHEAVRD